MLVTMGEEGEEIKDDDIIYTFPSDATAPKVPRLFFKPRSSDTPRLDGMLNGSRARQKDQQFAIDD